VETGAEAKMLLIDFCKNR